jgi:hypothetical protein
MTKLREPLTYERTLTNVAAAIGWDRVGAILGISERMARYLSDHDCETKIRMIDAERLDRAFLDHGGDHAPFHRLHALRLDLANRETPDRDLVALGGKAAKEAGEAIAALLDAGVNADRRAVTRARTEIQEAIDSLTDGLAGLDRLEKGNHHER